MDLDSEQQLVSEIWGLQVRIADTHGNNLLVADFEPAAFMDIWDRATGTSAGDQIAGAMYQSVLSNLQWGNIEGSPFLTALRDAATEGVLSIKFNVDGFNLDFTSPDFMTGRVVGTIGPATLAEPQHLVLGRQFMAAAGNGNFFSPAGKLNFCAGVVDASASCIYLDLGNALSTSSPGGPLNNWGDLSLGVYNPVATPGNPAGSIIALGKVPAAGPNGYASDASWYSRTAGVVALDIDAAVLDLVQQSPLVLSGAAGVSIAEWRSGAFVRADRYVYRMSPGDTMEIPIYATQFGAPLREVAIGIDFDESQLQMQVGEPGAGSPYVAPSPAVATSADALSYAASALTDVNGRAVLRVTASDPGTPRYFDGSYGIDGQVYGLRPGFVDRDKYGDAPLNQWNFISFLVWSEFRTKVAGQPTWYDDLQPIFQQYANLYPVMNRFLNLADYTSVVENARLLSLAFGLSPQNPNVMPVTRDLSPAKRAAILTWLSQSPPPLGSPPNPSPPPRPPRTAPKAKTVTMPGGKAAAVARRIVVQRAKGGQA